MDGMARDHVQYEVLADFQGQDWLVSWHPSLPPDGKRHGSVGVCYVSTGEIVLVRQTPITVYGPLDRESWDLPGGRPEGDEEWRTTLDREVLEEACAIVEDATLLGFTRGLCVRGHEEGLVLVRSFWRASISLREWQPAYETTQRLLVRPDVAIDLIAPMEGFREMYLRILHEAELSGS